MVYNIMNNCYEFKKLNTKQGIFENITDVCIILTCCESNNYYREKSIHEKLKKHNLHSNTYIVYNKGFKKCSKNPEIKNSTHDITHAVYTIFKTFINTNKILILEDDYIIHENYINHRHINNIENFLKNSEFDIYSLGGFCYFYNPLGIHQRCYDLILAQSNIYSKTYMEKFIDYYENVRNYFTVDTWYHAYPDEFLNYRYYLPIVAQTFPETENYKSWEISKIESFFVHKTINLLRLHEKIEPGWTIIYYIPLFFYIIIISIIIIWLRK